LLIEKVLSNLITGRHRPPAAFGSAATILPIRSRLIGTAPLVQSRSDLRPHFLRLSHHFIEFGEYRPEFVVADEHDSILVGRLSRN
jgi:hypothetical protein